MEGLLTRLERAETELGPLRKVKKDYRRLRHGLGEDEADRVIDNVKVLETEHQQQKKRSVNRDYVR